MTKHEESSDVFEDALMRYPNYSTLIFAGVLLLSAVMHATVHAGAKPTPPPVDVSQEWAKVNLGFHIGESGLDVVDLDGDGRAEIVAVVEQLDHWYVLSPEHGEYNARWVSFDDGDLTSLRTADVDGDGRHEIVVGHCPPGGSARITVFDGQTFEQQSTIETYVSEVEWLSVLNVDADPSPEYVFFDGSYVSVYDARTGDLEHYYDTPGHSQFSMGVANVDTDPDYEVVLSSGHILNALTGAEEWSWPGGQFVVGDLDRDGRAEIVAYGNGSSVSVFDVVVGGPQYVIEGWATAAAIVDLEEDGRPELLLGNAAGTVRVHDGANGASLWSVPTTVSDGRVVALAAYGGGTGRLVWSTENQLHVFDSTRREVFWVGQNTEGPFKAVAHGDIDADGRPEFAYWRISEYFPVSAIGAIHDAVTWDLQYETSLPDDGWVADMTLSNVDRDPQTELLVAVNEPGTSRIVARDGITQEEQWVTDAYAHHYNGLTVVDADGDGESELFASWDILTGIPFLGGLRMFDAATGQMEWSWSCPPDSCGATEYVRVGNVDNDPAPEVIANLGALHIFDAATHDLQLAAGGLDIRSLALADRDGDDNDEIFVGTADNAIRVVSPINGRVLETLLQYPEYPTFDGIYGLNVVDVNGDGIEDFVFVIEGSGFTSDRLVVRDGGSPEVELWGLDYDRSSLPIGNTLMVADIDDDGRIEITFDTGNALRVFEIRSPNSDPTIGPN